MLSSSTWEDSLDWPDIRECTANLQSLLMLSKSYSKNQFFQSELSSPILERFPEMTTCNCHLRPQPKCLDFQRSEKLYNIPLSLKLFFVHSLFRPWLHDSTTMELWHTTNLDVGESADSFTVAWRGCSHMLLRECLVLALQQTRRYYISENFLSLSLSLEVQVEAALFSCASAAVRTQLLLLIAGHRNWLGFRKTLTYPLWEGARLRNLPWKEFKTVVKRATNYGQPMQRNGMEVMGNPVPECMCQY